MNVANYKKLSIGSAVGILIFVLKALFKDVNNVME